MDNKVFDKILLNNEYVMKIYRPNKKRYMLHVLFVPLFSLLFFAGIVVAFILIISKGFNESFDASELVPLYVFMGVFVLIWLLGLVNSLNNFANTYYAVTNKRLIAKIGRRQDFYQYYDLKDLGYSQIRVTYLDKKMHPNTGTIIFSNQFLNKGIIVQKMNAPQRYIFSFNFIEDPYEVSRYISTLAEQAKLEE